MASQLEYQSASIAILLILLYLAGFAFSGSSKNLPPGPKRLPLIGNLHQKPKSARWLHYYNWTKEYGPIMYVNMGGQSLVIVSTNQAAQDLLSRKSAQYAHRPRMVMAFELVTRHLHMLWRPYDEIHRRHQRLEAPLLNIRSANCYRPIHELESRQLLFDIGNEYKVVGMKGSNFHQHFRRFTVSAIYTLLYGYRLKTGNEKEPTEAHHVQSESTRVSDIGAYLVDFLPVLNHLPGFLAPWKKEAEGLWDMERTLHLGNFERGLKNSGWNFTKHMMNTAEAKTMTTVELAYDLGILTIAALDTSTAALCWLVVAWITRSDRFVPKAQQLLDEVVGRDRLPQFEDRPRLAYIDAMVNEVIRWRPIAIGGVPHATKTEDVYMGYRIPAGSTVLPHHYAITRDEATFGNNVDDYVPERWLLQDGKDVADTAVPGPDDTLKDLPLVAFGFGRRICPGRHLARNGLFIAVARLLWAFNVEAGISETGEKVVVDDMALTEGFTTEPKPFNAVFHPRGPWVVDILNECDTHQIDHSQYLDRAGEQRSINMEKD
ncbi:cytochrome P450 [Biscogniauxia marginata]|nr:cytochrome P450 [Biscogniauxia marginata]